ncbi:hypothetical protein [Deinococcus yavapaiensis]|uniref:Uncharacterized protein n=1 Tax=Deinococcus yavapaiensis KR-236 TaxID=694435 RepID=A0A318S7V3_9DEIO|nr:hypothetical protein [Deinococcus yavapaiensis]PYE51851.1 hypothetical protein DES52_11452 [Deinococcus yavapaiensis KR-236]
MRAYRGIVVNGVIELQGARLPEGTVVTVTVGEGELLRATIANALRRPKRIKIRLKPATPGLGFEAPEEGDATPEVLPTS